MDLQYYISSEEASFFINNKMGSSDRIPTSGEYKVGDFIVSNTQENGIFGWVCTVAGIPGTWVEIVIGNSGGIPLDPELIAKINSIGDVTQLQTSNKTNIVNAINELDQEVNNVNSLANQALEKANELFQSVSSGKQSVANAITDKGVKTLATDSFATMSNNISKINSGKDIMVDGKPIGKDFELISAGEKITIQNSLPYDFYNGSAVVFNNEIHILGSGSGGSSYTNHYKFNGTTWTQVSTLPYRFSYGSAVVFNNEIHILGSSDSSSNYTKHYKFNGRSWTQVSTLPYNFSIGSAVVFNNEIHILGSSHSSNYTKHYKFNGGSWTQVSTLPDYFYAGSAVIYNNEIHILGGARYSSYTKHYKFNGGSWTQLSNLPYNFYYGSAVVYNNEIRILGGMGGENDYYKYDGSSWTQVSTLPYSFYNGSAVVHNNEIHILGSIDSSSYTNHYKSYKIYIMNIK